MKKEKTNSKNPLSIVGKNAVTLTTEAAENLKRALERYSASGVRVLGRQNKNGTPSYSLNLEENSRKDDLVLEDKGVKLFLDLTSAKLVRGFEIRYVKTERASGFAFVNPGG